MKLRPLPATAIALTAVVFVFLAAAGGPARAAVPDGYNPTQRPDPPGVPTRVSVAIFLLDVMAIDDLAQEFSADVFLTVRWHDARLAIGGADRVLPMSSVWTPAIAALNRRAIAMLLPQTVRVDSQGNVTLTQRVQGQVASPMDLREFPADEQRLEIRLASYFYSPEEIELEIDAARTGRMDTLTAAGWHLGAPELEVAALGVPGRERAGAILGLEARRDSRYYVLTMVMPLLLIALMAWLVFWIEGPAQFSISTAAIFSLIAFRLSLSLKLPKVSYLTKGDWYVLSITLLVFAALGAIVYTKHVAKVGNEQRADRINERARWAYLIALVLICVLTLRGLL